MQGKREEILDFSARSDNQDVSSVIQRALQRGLSLSYAKNAHSSDSLVSKVIQLSELCLPSDDHTTLESILAQDEQSIREILSNVWKYSSIGVLADKIRDQIETGFRLELSRTVGQKLAIGILAVAGGGICAVAAPGLFLVGYEVAASLGGFLGSGYIANRILSQTLEPKIYSTVLNLIISQLMEARKSRSTFTVQISKDVRRLICNQRIHSHEKAICLLFDGSLGHENFEGCKFEHCSEASKADLIQRIKCILKFHEIRDLIADQCFIGVIGPQDSGKTTLINAIWDVKGVTGYGPDQHTEQTTVYDITDKVKVVDFPGDTSFEEHANAFTICGAMNNIVIVILPFTGDISAPMAKALACVYGTMEKFTKAKIIVCINKCRHPFEDDEMKENIQIMTQRHVSTINDYFNGRFHIDPNNYFFTDFKILSEEARAYGIVGVDGIKEVIKRSLVDLELSCCSSEELNAAVSPKQNGINIE